MHLGGQVACWLRAGDSYIVLRNANDAANFHEGDAIRLAIGPHRDSFRVGELRVVKSDLDTGVVWTHAPVTTMVPTAAEMDWIWVYSHHGQRWSPYPWSPHP